MVGPLTTRQDLTSEKGEKIFNLPLTIQQPFLREKKEPIKVDISVKLIPKSRKKDQKRKSRDSNVNIVECDSHRGVKNSISMEVAEGSVNLLKENVEIIEADDDGVALSTGSSELQLEAPKVDEVVVEPIEENLPIEEKEDDNLKASRDIEEKSSDQNITGEVNEPEVEVVTASNSVQLPPEKKTEYDAEPNISDPSEKEQGIPGEELINNDTDLPNTDEVETVEQTPNDIT
ncbi:hypothetical protein JYU34_022148 [Plutella xylostella]|uniref:Uncharacterized protein n=1 Tax=Plutella xylostella TaxID=51655 RepID=A0ABQ7PQL4_PLUXY|nr:hypothetical protein JYU34_022148 [Plutella xylostella]